MMFLESEGINVNMKMIIFALSKNGIQLIPITHSRHIKCY